MRFNITQKEIAKELNINPATVSGMLDPKKDPPLSTLRRLSRVYGVSLDELATHYIDKTIKNKTEEN